MYTVIGNVKTRALRVTWTLEELGQPYDLIPAAPASDEAKQHVPTGKIPGLLLDGQIYTDSVAIMTFLADRHGALTYPAGTPDRMTQDGHIHFLNEEFDSLLWMASKHKFLLPKDLRVPAVRNGLEWDYQRSLDRLTDRLGDGPFLMGDTVTIADLLAAHCLNWAFASDFPAAPPVLADYARRMRHRPSYRAALDRA
ncbi:MAG: glutathione S-transferase family protein, partial [Pseudomonadota bacterium]